MAERRDLKLIGGFIETIREAITDDATGLPLNLTGATIKWLIKPADITADNATTVVTLSTTTGEITITDAAAGICEVEVPAQIPGTYWRRLDVITSTDRKPAIYGPLHVISV